jgi:hypothetical protein
MHGGWDIVPSDRLHQRRHGDEQVGRAEDWRLRVLVDGHDLAGLPDLPVVGRGSPTFGVLMWALMSTPLPSDLTRSLTL